jgi:SSS family solute:Na+ symporter
MILAIIVSPYMGIDKKGGFQFIQEMTGLLSPGILATFLMGFFWKKTNSAGAFFAIVGGFLIALWLNFNMAQIPFLDRMGMVFLICVAVMFVLGMVMPSHNKGLEIKAEMFKVDRTFGIGMVIVLSLVVALYAYFW